MKKVVKFILNKISRLIFKIIPDEMKFTYLIELVKKEFKEKTKLEKKLEEELASETIEVFKQLFKTTVLFTKLSSIRYFAISKAIKNDLSQDCFYLEFGTYKGDSTIYFSKYLKKIYTFDSFKGLRSDWPGNIDNPEGTFQLKKIPNFKETNIEIIDGYVEETLDDFLKKNQPKINFVHMDLDLYKPTKFTLERIKPFLVKGSIIIFDELFNYYGWRNGEYKALNEVFKDHEYKYKAFCINNQQAVIQII